MLPQLPTMKEEKTIEKAWMLTQLSICLPFLNEAMDSSFVKIYVYRSKEIIKGVAYLFLGFQRFISEAPLKGPEEGEIWWGKV